MYQYLTHAFTNWYITTSLSDHLIFVNPLLVIITPFPKALEAGNIIAADNRVNTYNLFINKLNEVQFYIMQPFDSLLSDEQNIFQRHCVRNFLLVSFTHTLLFIIVITKCIWGNSLVSCLFCLFGRNYRFNRPLVIKPTLSIKVFMSFC